VIIMARPQMSYSAQCWVERENAERKLGDVMSKPNRTDAELERARQNLCEAERRYQTYRDGRLYSG
jgi:hypothetical protein